ncbi:glutathione peroxidase [Sphingobium sp. TomTYG75]
MSDTPPDRLSTNPRSPHFDMDVLQRGIGIRFKDRVRNDVEEYCISEGWIRVAAGKTKDRHGQPLTIKLSGPVEAWFERGADGEEEKAADAE